MAAIGAGVLPVRQELGVPEFPEAMAVLASRAPNPAAEPLTDPLEPVQRRAARLGEQLSRVAEPVSAIAVELQVV